MLIVFFRAIILYVVVIFSIRLMGKRQLGELQPSELVVTILISNIATLPIEDINIPMATGVIPIFTIVCLDVIMSASALKWRRLRRLMSGSPKIIISEGVIDQQQMKKLRYTVDDLMESLRSQGVFDVSEVQFAVVETTGKISVYQKAAAQPLSQEAYGLEPKEKNPPQIIIDDGDVIRTSLRFIGMSEKKLQNILNAHGLKAHEVFLMTSDGGGKTVIIKKNYQGESKS